MNYASNAVRVRKLHPHKDIDSKKGSLIAKPGLNADRVAAA